MNNCNKLNLELFSQEHYTYINQIFGDATVREIIKEMYTERDWNFVVNDADVDFEYSNHHILEKPGKDGKTVKWCSVDEGFQNININKNDTLCQSYTLLKYLNKPIDTSMKKRQMEMIKMYRNIIKRDYFQKELKGMIEIMSRKIKRTTKKNNPALWKDYTNSPETYLYKDFNTLYAEIHSVLDKWEKNGYFHFIKEGMCPVKR
jgi:hypothetical protein